MNQLHPKNSTFMQNPRKGTALLLVMIVAAITTLLLGSILRLTSFERSANTRQILRSESRLAAESLANYAAAEVVHQFETQPLSLLANYNAHTLSVPQDVLTQLGKGRIEPSSLLVSIVPDQAGLIPMYIDPQDPANVDDPLKGKITHVRNFNIYAQASAQNGSHNVQSYAEMGIQVRESPFFSYGIFYAMDLEFMPETAMEVSMPIHTNKNFVVSCSDYINFYEMVTAAGKVLHGVKVSDGNKNPGSMGDVFFQNLSGDLVSMRRAGTDGTDATHWIDNHTANEATWLDDSNAAFSAMLQDEAHGVPEITLAGFDPYLEGSDHHGADSENHAYAIIEPVLPTDHPNYKGVVVQEQKFAKKAGLILRISGDKRYSVPYWANGEMNPGYTPNTYTINAYKYQRDADGKPVIDVGTNRPVEIEVKLPAGLIGDANGAMNAIDVDAAVESFRNYWHRTGTEVITQVPVYEKEIVRIRKNIQDELDDLDDEKQSKTDAMNAGNDNITDTPESIDTWYNNAVTAILAKNEGDSDDMYYTIEEEQDRLDANGDQIQLTDTGGNLVYDTVVTLEDHVIFPVIESGLNDIRQNKYMDIVSLNVQRLRELVNENPGQWGNDYAGRNGLDKFNPVQDWNGIVYLELPYEESSRSDNIVVSNNDELGVMLINGEDLPTRAHPTQEEGFTFATNAPVYILGNYNADGDLTTGTTTQYEADEVPALILADSVTVLSDEFADAEAMPTDPDVLNTWTHSGRRQIAGRLRDWQVNKYARTPVEVSAAVIAGITPTIPQSQNNFNTNLQSGGVHNFFRFMQDWSPDDNPTDFVYRGSIVVLFESMVHNKKIEEICSYEEFYEPPNRFYGFNNLFREGKYPPGTPKGRTYRKTTLNYPSFNDYEAELAVIP